MSTKIISAITIYSIFSKNFPFKIWATLVRVVCIPPTTVCNWWLFSKTFY